MIKTRALTPTAAVWTGALLSSLLGAAILFDALPGINWPLWVASASAAVIFARRAAGASVGKPVLILLAWAAVLASVVAITSNEFIQVLVILSDAMLLGLAVVVTGTEAWRSLSAQLLPTVPFLAPFRVGTAAFREAAGAPRAVSSPRARPIVRGLLLTIPILIALVALLRNADPVIAWTWDRIADLLPEWSFWPRVLFFFFLLVLTLGASSVSARQTEPRLPRLLRLSERATLGLLEQRMVLIGISVVLWLFVILQIAYLFQSPPTATGSGVTFAEYARKGFGELSLAVTLVGGVILLLEATRPPAAPGSRALVALEIGLLVALELILVSAFRRVVLYEQAYGFTTARLFAQAYMVVIALSLLALSRELGKGGISVNFGRRVSVIALGVFTVLAFWNYEAWILNRNIDRSVVTGKFDFAYARRLSLDALPTLVERRSELPAAERQSVDEWLACTPLPAPRRWFEANQRIEAARQGLLRTPNRRLPTKLPCPSPTKPSSAPPTGTPAS
jgi:hypothetical protein